MTKLPPPTPPNPEPSDQDVKELAKLTTNFYVALNELLPAAIRASKRGKHGLLRLISRKLPRPKLPGTEDPEADRAQDEDAAAIAENIRSAFKKPLQIPPAADKKEVERKEERPPKSKPIAPAAPPPPLQPTRTSGAPRSLNEEPWPGKSNFPRPFHRRLKKPT
jgi:hypothetical protein